MEISVEHLAGFLNGTLEGETMDLIKSLAKIEDAQKGDVSFLANSKYEHFIYTTKASAIIVADSFIPNQPIVPVLIRVKDPYSSFAMLLEQFDRNRALAKTGIEQPSFISPTAVIGQNVYVGAFAYIGENAIVGDNAKIYPHVYLGDDTIIGDNSVLHPGVKIYRGCKIGRHCTLHAGTIIGSDGFGFAPQADGSYKAIPQTGGVIIGNHVDIGANTVIDRATMGNTVLEDGVKLDNLIQIAHNVTIGAHTVVAAQTGISGSTIIGKNCMIGGQSGIVGHILVADGTKIGAQSGVSKSVLKTGVTLQGSPAFEYSQNLKSYVVYKKLPDLQKRIEFLEQKILSLPNKSSLEKLKE